jgi:hypothetical protein
MGSSGIHARQATNATKARAIEVEKATSLPVRTAIMRTTVLLGEAPIPRIAARA